MKKAIALILFIMAMGAYVNHIEAVNTPVTFYQVTVRGGDTIWEFAKQNTKPGEDIREQLWQIREDNDLKYQPSLQPGTVLNIRKRT